MRVMLKNPEGCWEILLVEKASVALSGNVLRLVCAGNVCVDVDVGSNYTAHMHMNELLKDGYTKLSDFYADYKQCA